MPWWPLVTAAVCVAALVTFASPGLQHALTLDRDALWTGEWWRLFTGHLVHFTPRHLIYDLAVVLVAGLLAETHSPRETRRLYLLSGPGISIILIAAEPQMQVYGGLSGVATGLAVFACLSRIETRGAIRWLARGTLLLIALKLGWELTAGASLFFAREDRAFVPVPMSHLAGAVIATGVFVAARLRGTIRPPDEDRHAAGPAP